MKRRNALKIVRSVATDNGCEFLDQKWLDRLFEAEAYYRKSSLTKEIAPAYDSRLANAA